MLKKMNGVWLMAVVMVLPAVGRGMPVTVTFSGTGQVEDTTVCGGSPYNTLNDGGDNALSVGKYLNGGNSHTLIRFLGLDTLKGYTVTSATLKLYSLVNVAYQTQRTTVQVYEAAPANVNWVPGTKAWSGSQAGASCWSYKVYATSGWAGSAGASTAGTDYLSPLLASAVVSNDTRKWYTLTIPASVVQGWIDNYAAGSKNPGLFLKESSDGATAGSQASLGSSERAGASPELDIQVEPPVQWVPVETKSGSIRTQANSQGENLQMQFGRVHVDGTKHVNIKVTGTITNWSDYTAPGGHGAWGFISLFGSDYFINRAVPASADEGTATYAYPNNDAYGTPAKRRGFAANGGLVLWQGAESYGVLSGFAAEDCSPNTPTGHSTNFGTNFLFENNRFDFEIRYYLDSMTMQAQVRDVGGTAWTAGSCAIGYRNAYPNAVSPNDDWSDVVMSAQMENDLTPTESAAEYGYDYTMTLWVGDPLPGDATLDDQVTFEDFAALQNRYGQSGGWSEGDFDGDGTVSFADFSILQNHYGQAAGAAPAAESLANAAIPCSSLGLVGLAVLAAAFLLVAHLNEE